MCSWTELSIDNDVVAAVETMAVSEGQPILGENGPQFEWRPDVSIEK